MVYVVFVVFNISIVLFTVISIYKDQSNRRRRKNTQIIVLNRNINYLLQGLASIVFFIIFSSLFISKIHWTYSIVNENYIDSVFQLLDFKHIASLRQYFYDNSMLREFHAIACYQADLLPILTWIIGCFCFSILYFYKGRQRNIIYEEGILEEGYLIKWDRILAYKWSNVYQKRYFMKGEYSDLILSLPKTKLFNLDNQVKLRVKSSDKEVVNRILEKKLNSE